MDFNLLGTTEEFLEIFFIDITKELSTSIYKQCLELMPIEKINRLNRFRFEDDKKRSMYGEVMARIIFMKRLSLTNEHLKIVTNEYGKPYFENILSLHFNISHSGRYVICGISNMEIGVDVEEIKLFHEDIVKRFFTKEEYVSFSNLEKEVAKRKFYIYWTLKESYVKYQGKGLMIPLDSFSIQPSGDHYQVLSEQKTEEIRLYSHELDTTYMIGAAFQKSDCKVIIREFELEKELSY